MERSVLSDKAILRHIEQGTVVITPFTRENLTTSSYDVTLGPYYFRETTAEPGLGIFNPWSEKSVQKVWGNVLEAESYLHWKERSGTELENVFDDDKVIWLSPGETVLGHTQEYIGGRNPVTTMMKARSSIGRNFIEVCKCAGWGDVGYVNRWTMEITNNSRHYSIPLVVGRRIAQIVFMETEGTLNTSYEQTGKYQVSSDIEKLKSNWSPSQMIPKLYMDREIKAKKNKQHQQQ